MQDELSRRLKAKRASSTAGLGAAFVAAASPKLLPGEGRLALVLPATVCTGPSWNQTRALIEQDFILDMVIASHDPERWNFSESTSLSEVLLIATRRSEEKRQTNHRIVHVNLWQNPSGVLDAHRLANAITAVEPAPLEKHGSALLEVDGHHVGELISIPEEVYAGRKWFGVQFARADTLRVALRLLIEGEVWIPGETTTTTIPLCQLDQLGKVGPDRRDVWDGFERTGTVTAYHMVENHDTEQRKRMVTEPDKYLAPLVEPRAGRHLRQAAQLWQQAGRLLVAERLWLETTRVVAMHSSTPVLSNVWWPIKTDNEAYDKAIAVWLNCSLGLLTILAQRTTTRGGWVAMKKADLKELPILDLRLLTEDQLKSMSNLFDEMAESEFERLPAMAVCPARQALDDGIANVLGLPDLGKLRHLIASEPVVSNRRL